MKLLNIYPYNKDITHAYWMMANDIGLTSFISGYINEKITNFSSLVNLF